MDIKDFKNYESVSKFNLDEREREIIFNATNNLIKSFEALGNINTDNVEPLITVLPLKTALREDIAKEFMSRDELMSNAVEYCDGYYQVPKTIE